jgi:hypothetical protein
MPSAVNSGRFKKGNLVGVKTQFTSERISGDKNYRWAGDDVGYFGLHFWIKKVLGRPIKCEFCGISKGKIEWANRSHEYKRVISDWVRLCTPCHKGYDGLTKFSKEEAKVIKLRYSNGESQRSMAREFSVSSTTISNVITGKVKFYA